MRHQTEASKTDRTVQQNYGLVGAWGIIVAFAAILTAPAVGVAQEGGGVINLEETVIEGNIQKPEAFYILQHANLNYQSLEPKKSFIPELMRSVDREPIKSTRPTEQTDE